MKKISNCFKIIGGNILNVFNKVPKQVYFIILVALLLMSPILEFKISWGHDYPFHVANLMAANDSLDFSNFHFIISKVFDGGIVRGFGYGTGIFYPPITYVVSGYLGHFLHMFGIAYPYTITLIELLVMGLSGIFMFMLVKKNFKDNNVAFLGAISYISAPYFISDIYIRCSFNELFTFMFIPLVFLGLYYLFNEDTRKFLVCFIIGYVGMIFSHVVISLYLTIFVLLTLLINYKKVFNLKTIKYLCIAAIVILLITSPFWVLMLEHKLFGDYLVFKEGIMSSWSYLAANDASLRDLFVMEPFKGKSSGVHLYFNIVTFFMFLVTLVYYKKVLKQNEKSIFVPAIAIFIISFLLVLYLKLWKFIPDSLYIIQFPWRLEIFMIFAMGLVIGLFIRIFEASVRKFAVLVCSFGIIIAGFVSIPLEWTTFLNLPDDMAFGSSIGAEGEYFPAKVKDDYGYLWTRDDKVHVLEGSADIETIDNKTPYLLASINLKTDNAVLELPRLYYFGYEITLKGENNEVHKISYVMDEKGFIKFKVNESGILTVKYTGGLVTLITRIVSLITVLICVILLILSHNKNMNAKKTES